MDRFAGGAIPHHDRLTLVGDADRRDIGGGEVGGRERLRAHLARIHPYLRGVVFHPAVTWEDLIVLPLLGGHDGATTIEDDAPGGTGALIDRGDELRVTM
ncbi:hypothetical protein TTY48_08470 [Tsukamurella sp. TY48]|nr:hypothetical protein TTY48_08470 [Tsukamurella sp. TY48]